MSRAAALTLGVDEAGRGPALGPLVLAVVGVDAARARALTAAGVRDSKAFGSTDRARATRARLATLIGEVARYAAVRVVEVAEVDRAVAAGQLNRLEREVAAGLIAAAPAARRIVCDGARLFGALGQRFAGVEAVDHGEDHHVAVAAASVLAKARRDEAFAAIAARYAAEFGPLTGGGYCNAATRSFLRAYASRYRRLPPEARRSWPHRYLDDLLPPDAAAPAEGAQLRLL